ncbi:MAG TPA: class I SAM-dependent methyltransferase [Thermoanaerobaculia bacterium]|nr:class I SAM-dependent methyltransferase [Thermoanaerobaculia bacterium]
MTFKDHFSGHARDYASYRPGYPEELFDFVSSLPRRRGTAWDVGTGNGQAALGLAERFDRVIGTDPSAQQIEQAEPHPRIEYRVAPAEASGLPDASVDLVAAAQAFHWFDFDRFFAEARRVLAPGGAVVVWTYNLARVSPPVDAWIDRLAHGIVGPYWPPERKWVNEEYRTIPFPFPEVEAPSFIHSERWELDRYLSYVRTWSAFQRYVRETGSDPVEEGRGEIEAAWGDPPGTRTIARTISWPIFLRASQPMG